MRVAVAYKWAADPQEATVDTNGSVDLSRAKPVVSDYDAVAIEVGRRFADSTGAELVGLCAGGPAAAAPMASKAALARGLDSVRLAVASELADAGTTQIAAALAALVRDLGDVALVLTGDSSIDVGAKMVPAVLGGLLCWPALTDVTQLTPDGDTARVTRTVGAAVQELRLPLPAVVAVSTGAVKVKAPGMKDVLAAGKKPVQVMSADQLGPLPADRGELKSAEPLTGPARGRVRIDGADPQAAARELIAALRQDGLLAGISGERS